MKIAITGKNLAEDRGAESLKIFEVDQGKILSKEKVPIQGTIAAFLRSQGVSVLVCGGIGEKEKAKMQSSGIKIYHDLMRG